MQELNISLDAQEPQGIENVQLWKIPIFVNFQIMGTKDGS